MTPFSLVFVDVLAESTDNDCTTFGALFPTDVTLQNYIVIDDCFVMTGLLTDHQIINDVTGIQENHGSNKESREKMQPRPDHT